MSVYNFIIIWPDHKQFDSQTNHFSVNSKRLKKKPVAIFFFGEKYLELCRAPEQQKNKFHSRSRQKTMNTQLRKQQQQRKTTGNGKKCSEKKHDTDNVWEYNIFVVGRCDFFCWLIFGEEEKNLKCMECLENLLCCRRFLLAWSRNASKLNKKTRSRGYWPATGLR